MSTSRQLEIRPGDEIMVQHADYLIPIAVPVGRVPVDVKAGLIGFALLPTDDGKGWVIDFPPFGEAEVPTDWLM